MNVLTLAERWIPKVGKLRAERLEKVATVLDSAADLVDKGWCQNSIARDAEGKPVNELSEDAVAFCADGAIVRAAWEHTLEQPDVKDAWGKTMQLRGVCGAAVGRWLVAHKLANDMALWNDAVMWRGDKVSAALREVAEIERAKVR